MTSTSFNVGLSDNTRLSSRVLRPPGGGHTDIFGSEPEPQRTGRRMAPNPAQQAAAAEATAAEAAPPAAPAEEAPQLTSTEAPEQNGQVNSEAPPVENSAPAKAVTPVNSETKTETQTADAPATGGRRVRVPPGGFSSGLW